LIDKAQNFHMWPDFLRDDNDNLILYSFTH